MRRRPRVVVAHDADSPPLISVFTSADGEIELAWLVDSSTCDLAEDARAYRRLGTLIDVAGTSPEERVRQVAAFQPDGIVALADSQLRAVADLTERLGLPGHTRQTAELLTDKHLQRTALRRAGLAAPNSVLVPKGSVIDELESQLDALAYPAVLKPRRGAISRDTYAVADVADVRRLMTHAGLAALEDYVVEEQLGSATAVPYAAGGGFADYVSVESLSARGVFAPVMVTGRLPLAPPYRETGYVVPSQLSPRLTAAVVDEAARAAAALGVTDSALHTEVKVVDGEPVILEVNGRAGGGGIVHMITEVTSGDFGKEVLRVAAGLTPPPASVWSPTPGRFAYLYLHPSPLGRHRLRAVEGLSAVGAWPGVSEVYRNLDDGDVTDTRIGSGRFVYSVRGVATSPEAVAELPARLSNSVKVTSDVVGNPSDI